MLGRQDRRRSPACARGSLRASAARPWSGCRRPRSTRPSGDWRRPPSTRPGGDRLERSAGQRSCASRSSPCRSAACRMPSWCTSEVVHRPIEGHVASRTRWPGRGRRACSRRSCRSPRCGPCGVHVEGAALVEDRHVILEVLRLVVAVGDADEGAAAGIGHGVDHDQRVHRPAATRRSSRSACSSGGGVPDGHEHAAVSLVGDLTSPRRPR